VAYGQGLATRLLDLRRARPFEMTRRPMKGWIVVDAGLCAEDEDLSWWVSRGVEHARALPPK
jgi:hypothetical protein